MSGRTFTRPRCARTRGDLLGIVGADYEPLDNRQAFRFLDELIGSQLHFETACNYADQFKRLGDRLALEPISERALRRGVLDCLFAAPESMGDRAARNREEANQAVLAIFRGRGSADDTWGVAPGTKWCAANGIAEYAHFGRRYTRRSNQVQRSFEEAARVRATARGVTAFRT